MNGTDLERLARAATNAVEAHGEYVEGLSFKCHVYLGDCDEIEILTSSDLTEPPFIRISVDQVTVFDADFDRSGDTLLSVYEYLSGNHWEEQVLAYSDSDSED